MSAWDLYNSRLEAKGATLRGARIQRESGYINRKLPSSLSYHTVIVNGVEQQLAIINSDTLDIKTICSLPGEDIQSGSLVEWEDNRWLVIREDVNRELYTKATMQQCNYPLRWIVENDNHIEIVERWCIISDGTRYLVGETNNSFHNNGMSIGDTRIAMFIARDLHTVKLNRSNRFLIDDYDSPTVLAYRLTKPFKLGGVYNDRGVMSFVLSEVNTEDYDNFELHIADYYKYFPRETGLIKEVAGSTEVVEILSSTTNDGRRVWL